MAQDGIVSQRCHYLLARDESSERHTATQRLCQADNVGRYAISLHSEHLTRATHTGLYLIEDKQRSHLRTTLTQSLQVTILRRSYTRLTLHGLAQYASCALGYLL